MEECVRRNEAEGKEINPTTCTFVKKCKAGEVRNDKGRCVKAKTKTKQNTPNVVPFAPFVYQRPLAEKKKVTITRKRAKTYNRNKTTNYTRTTGKPGRKTYTAKLLPHHNVNTAVRGRATVRNSRNLSYLNTMRLPIDELEEELEENKPSPKIAPPKNSRFLQKRKAFNKKQREEENAAARQRLQQGDSPNNSPVDPVVPSPVAPGIRI